MNVLRDAWVIAKKDLKVEIRSKEILLTMGYFAFLVVLIFAFAFFQPGLIPGSAMAAGILWVSIAFSGTLGLSRAFDREREGDCLRALLLTPVARPSIYLGKTVAILVVMLIIEMVVIPAVVFFFNLRPELEFFAMLLGIVVLGTIGYAVVGSLLAAMLVRARSKDVLLVIVLYPMILPVIVAGVKATSVLLGTPAEDAVAVGVLYKELGVWVPMLVFFDLVFLVASLWMFETLLTD